MFRPPHFRNVRTRRPLLGHRELPISADFVGRKIVTDLHGKVVVSLEVDGEGEDGVQVTRGNLGGEAM